MKKIIVYTLSLLIFGLTSCKDNNSIEPEDIDIPTAVQNALIREFPDAVVNEWNILTPQSFQADFLTKSQAKLVSFNSIGSILGMNDKIDPASLPATILTYLGQNYKGHVITKAGSKVDKKTNQLTGYEVNIVYNNLKYELNFDSSGKFLSVESGEIKQDKPKTKKKEISLLQKELLMPIANYLEANYKGYSFESATAKTENLVVKEYEVKILYNGKKLKIKFDSTGKFVKVD